MDVDIKDLNDPRWVGAWWIGFVGLGAGIVLASLPMFLFPREFKGSPGIQKMASNIQKGVMNGKKINENIWDLSENWIKFNINKSI